MTLNGINVSAAAGADVGATATAVAAAINGNATLAAKVTATTSGADVIITSDVPGADFTLATTSSNLTSTTIVENQTADNRSLRQGDLVINGVAIPGGLDASDILTNESARSSDNAGSAIAIAEAINSKSGETGVKAVANAAVMSATSAMSAASKLPPARRNERVIPPL